MATIADHVAEMLRVAAAAQRKRATLKRVRITKWRRGTEKTWQHRSAVSVRQARRFWQPV